MSASPSQNENDPSSPETVTPEIPTQQAGERSTVPWFGLLFALIAILIMGRAVFVWVSGDGEWTFRRFAFLDKKQISLYEAAGKVLINGEPLNTGHVEFHPANKNGPIPDRIIGVIKEGGTFEIYTDFGTGLKKGAPQGEYKVLLVALKPAQGMGPPEKLLPVDYYDESLTPITVTVTSDPGKNHFLIKESADLKFPLEPSGNSSNQTGQPPAQN